MKGNDVGKLNKQLGSLSITLDYYKHQVISSYCYIVVMVIVEEEQRRKHELALSRVMALEQQLVTHREASQTHIDDAKQVKVIMVIL